MVLPLGQHRSMRTELGTGRTSHPRVLGVLPPISVRPVRTWSRRGWSRSPGPSPRFSVEVIAGCPGGRQVRWWWLPVALARGVCWAGLRLWCPVGGPAPLGRGPCSSSHPVGRGTSMPRPLSRFSGLTNRNPTATSGPLCPGRWSGRFVGTPCYPLNAEPAIHPKVGRRVRLHQSSSDAHNPPPVPASSFAAGVARRASRSSPVGSQRGRPDWGSQLPGSPARVVGGPALGDT